MCASEQDKQMSTLTHIIVNASRRDVRCVYAVAVRPRSHIDNERNGLMISAAIIEAWRKEECIEVNCDVKKCELCE